MTEPVLEFTAPGDPVPKGRPRFARVGAFVRAYTPAETMRYEERLIAYCSEAIHREFSCMSFPLDEPISVQVHLTFRRPKSRKKAVAMDRKPDLENVIKSVFDALEQAGAVKNDSRIVELRARKVYGEHPETRVVLWTLGHPERKPEP